jgi:hypothetical protein
MGEIIMEDAVMFEDKSWLDIVYTTAAGDSPLAHAIRRRQWEIAHPEETVATHDSMI